MAAVNGLRRPSVTTRHPTAPTVLTTMNGHFATAGDGAATREQYNHGVQVIDQDKEFKYVKVLAYFIPNTQPIHRDY